MTKFSIFCYPGELKYSMTQTTWERWSTDRGRDREIVEERRSQKEMKMRTDHEALVCNIYTFLSISISYLLTSVLQKVESDTDGSKRSTSSQSHSRHRRRRSNRRRNKSEEELERERISLEQDRASNESCRRLSKVLQWRRRPLPGLLLVESTYTSAFTFKTLC